MLKQFFIELYKLRTKKKDIGDKEINKFLWEMDLTIKSVKRIIDQKVNEYVDNEK